MSKYHNFNNYNKYSVQKEQRVKHHKAFHITTYESELYAIASEALKTWKNEKETGGPFYGLLRRSGEFILMLATGPGKKAYHSKYRFKMDLKFLKKEDKHLKDNFKLDHQGDWHTHLIDLDHPSTDDMSNTHKISKKNDYTQYIQFIITIHNDGRKKELKFNPYIYIDAKFGLPYTCQMNVLPGKSPIRLALEHNGDIHKMTEIFTYNGKQLTIRPSIPETISSLTNSPPTIEEKLDKRFEKQLLKLPPEVLSRVEIEIIQGVTIVTVPILSSSYRLYLAYIEERPGEIRSVYLGEDRKKSPVEVTIKALKNGPYTHVKTIWSMLVRFVGLNQNDRT